MKNLPARSLCAIALLVLAVVSCKFGSSSPTTVFKAFFEAQKKKDVPAIKKTLSKGSLEMMEKVAKEQGKTTDEALTEGFSKSEQTDKMPEIRNEKIEGDNGTLEVQDEKTKDWQTMYFVKEDKEWKVALDKTVEEMIKKIGQP
jgi:Domain of unknown function (DUF4878)